MNILSNLNTISRGFSPTSSFGGAAPTMAPSGMGGLGDMAGLSAEALLGGGDQMGGLSGLLAGMMEAYAPQDPVERLQAEIQQVQQQLTLAQGLGDAASVEALSQRLEQLQAQLAQMKGQGPVDGGGRAHGGGGGGGGDSFGGGGGGGDSFSGGSDTFSGGGDSSVDSSGGSAPSASGQGSQAGTTTMTGNSDTPIMGGGTDQYDDLIQQAAEKHGVDPNLIKSMIQQESAFDPNAVSHVGAQGLMQLMPATAAELGVENSLDPAQNIEGGTKYIAQQLEAFDGNVELALAAYNAGAGNVRKHDGIPPFEETQNYVAKVTADYAERTALANAAAAVTEAAPAAAAEAKATSKAASNPSNGNSAAASTSTSGGATSSKISSGSSSSSDSSSSSSSASSAGSSKSKSSSGSSSSSSSSSSSGSSSSSSSSDKSSSKSSGSSSSDKSSSSSSSSSK